MARRRESSQPNREVLCGSHRDTDGIAARCREELVMRIPLHWIACTLTLAMVSACKDSSAAKAPPSQQPAPTPSKAWPMKPLEEPPKQSDLDAKASKDINDANADAEFEKLKKEIEGGG
jgi:hypothetical protein